MASALWRMSSHRPSRTSAAAWRNFGICDTVQGRSPVAADEEAALVPHDAQVLRNVRHRQAQFGGHFAYTAFPVADEEQDAQPVRVRKHGAELRVPDKQALLGTEVIVARLHMYASISCEPSAYKLFPHVVWYDERRRLCRVVFGKPGKRCLAHLRPDWLVRVLGRER